MIELALFVSTFVAVFALGVQSLNVNNGHYVAAFLTSFVIGTGNLVLFKLVPGDTTGTQLAAYLLGGPFGIVAAMWFHKRTIGRKRQTGKVPAAHAWPPTPDFTNYSRRLRPHGSDRRTNGKDHP